MLEIRGTKSVGQSPERLWNLLLDVDVLRRCIPGCEALSSVGPLLYRMALRVGDGILRSRFRGEVGLSEVVEAQSCRLEWTAKGLAGVVRGFTDVRLCPLEGAGGTGISYQGQARVGGALRALSPGVFQKAVASFTERFFEELSRQ